MASVQEETLAVAATGLIVDKRHNCPLLLQRRRHRLTEENLRKVSVPGEKVLLEGKASKCANISSEESVRIRRVIIGILPNIKITRLYRDQRLFSHTEADGQPSKKSNESRMKVVERMSCLTEGVYTIGLCVPRVPSEKVYSAESWKIGIEPHRQILQGHVAPQKIGKERSIARRHSKV